MRPSLQLNEILHPLDWLVFGFVLLLTLGFVVWGNLRRRRLVSQSDESASMLDLLLMGRRLTLPMFTATLVATWYGGIFGVSEWAFTMGIYNWLTQGVFWYAAYLIFAFCLVRRVRRTQAYTMPDLLAKMYGPRSAKLGACFNVLNLLPLTYIIGIGVFFHALFGGATWMWMVGGTLFVLAYSTAGGLRAVVYSDLIQFVVMCSAVALVIVFSVQRFGGLGWLMQNHNIPDTHWQLDGGQKLGLTLIWGFIALGTLVDPNFYQRCLAAKDERTARNGILWATGIWVVFDFCTTFGAMYALAAIPDAEPKLAYVTYSTQILPVGLRGFFLAGILATILSTVDSYLFLSGTTVAYDLAPAKRKGSVKWHHVGTIAVALVALVLAIVYEKQTALVNIWKTIGGFTAACLLLPLTIGYLIRFSDRAFVRSALLGALSLSLASGGLFSRLHASLATIEPFYFGLAGSLLGIALAVATEGFVLRKNDPSDP